MKRLLIVLLLLPVCCYAAEPAKPPAKPPVVAPAEAQPKAWPRACAVLNAVYGGQVAPGTVDEIVTSFVTAAAKGNPQAGVKGDPKAPVNGDGEAKAKYYLRILREVHDRQWIGPEAQEAAQKAAEERTKELRARLPQ